MTTEENLVDPVGSSQFHDFFAGVGDPIPTWDFDLFVDEKPLWLVTKVRVDGGRMSIRQVLNASGMYTLSGKTIRVVFYSDVPSIVTELSFTLGRIEDVSLSCDSTAIGECAEIEAIYKCKFVSITNHCEKNSA